MLHVCIQLYKYLAARNVKNTPANNYALRDRQLPLKRDLATLFVMTSLYPSLRDQQPPLK